MSAHDLAAVREAFGPELGERLLHLDAVRAAPRPPPLGVPAPQPEDRVHCDVVLMGGGLSLLYAPILARAGLSVSVIERARAGQGHREWNASYPELRALVEAGLVSDDELERLIVARYREGTCAFHGGGSYAVRGVLDCAVDATLLLEMARKKAENLGVTFLDGHTVAGLGAGNEAVRIRVAGGNGKAFDLVARAALDARGVSSPYASADLVCPTVGGVLKGLSIDPTVGEILATIDDADEGRQHVWEAFPGREGETTVYVFYYAKAGNEGSLLSLYGRFARDMGRYKKGAWSMVRPTFGYIPGWSRLTPAPASPHPRVLLVGDAASRHSPLTYCGFGATLRSLAPVTRALVSALDAPRFELPASVVDDAPVHRWTGALAALMASETASGSALNALLDAAFSTLHAMGEASYASLLRDEMSAADFVTFLRRTSLKRPEVYADVWKGLGRASLPPCHRSASGGRSAKSNWWAMDS